MPKGQSRSEATKQAPAPSGLTKLRVRGERYALIPGLEKDNLGVQPWPQKVMVGKEIYGPDQVFEVEDPKPFLEMGVCQLAEEEPEPYLPAYIAERKSKNHSVGKIDGPGTATIKNADDQDEEDYDLDDF